MAQACWQLPFLGTLIHMPGWLGAFENVFTLAPENKHSKPLSSIFPVPFLPSFLTWTQTPVISVLHCVALLRSGHHLQPTPSSIDVSFEELQTIVQAYCKGHLKENKSPGKEKPWLQNVLFRNNLVSLKHAQYLSIAYQVAPNTGFTCQIGGF